MGAAAALYSRGFQRNRTQGDRRKGKDTLKTSGLFHELTEGIKGLINCRLDARRLNDRQWSKAEGGCHKSAHVRVGHVLIRLEEVFFKSPDPSTKETLLHKVFSSELK